MGRHVSGPNDINTRKLIRKLENTKILVFKEIASILKGARRARPEANLAHINRVVKDGDVIVVPGKVLGSGALEHKNVTIGALAWSESVAEKAKTAGAKLLSLPQILEQYPNGSNIRLVK
ncbi:MAG: 50S ribosomal protein L18e [Candidatus Lokiarchaeota archaeon]|nr:50S ribosomal protein L18e [Candidatus Lokiarchaeota archaeon]